MKKRFVDMELNEFERLDDLQLNGIKIFQDKRMFCFGVDAVLLANFAALKAGDNVLDMCSGNGIIPLILSVKSTARHIICLEIQQRNCQLVEKSIAYNKLENKISVVCDDLNNWKNNFSPSSFDTITCNPPYIKLGGGLLNPADEKKCARHEVFCTMEDVVSVSSVLLKPGGKLFLIYRTDRLAELIYCLKSHKLEPKRMRLVHSREGDRPNLVLIESTRGGKPDIIVEPPLYVYKNQTEYSDEINEIYGRI